MSRNLTRVFALVALAALLATAGVAWRVAHPPWKAIQSTRIEARILDARADLERERAHFTGIEGSLEYRRALAAADEALAARATASDRLAEIAELRADREALEGSLRRRIAELDDRRTDAPDHAAFVRLSGSAGITEGELRRWIEEHGGDGGPEGERATLEGELAANLDELARLDAEEERLAGPAREATGRLEAFRADLDRSEARLERLEGFTPGIREIVTPAGDLERCTTCHPGLDDLTATHASQSTDSPYQGWGCTICHGGNGRALDVDEAHRLLTLRPWSTGNEYDLMPLIDRLDSPDKGERAATAAFLRRLTGREFGYVYHASAERRAGAVRAWRTWWLASRGFYRPPYPAGLQAFGHDASGRPEAYTGAGSCLRCHEARQRRHVERWRGTKFDSFDRLDEVDDPTPCLPCHTTGYDPSEGTYVQPGVTCEGCHGPGAGYGAAMEAGVRLQAVGAEDEGERLLDEVSTELRERMTQGNVCIECHDPFGVKDLAFEHRM